jgi:glycine oxidase
MLGPSGVDGLVIATGHHRNGILLTPVSADVVSQYILTERLPDIARPFSPERFAAGHNRPPSHANLAAAR